MKLFAILLISWITDSAWSLSPSFTASGDGGYSQFHLASTSGALPTYRGTSFGGVAVYSLKFKNGFSVGPYVSISQGSYENTANDLSFSEKVSMNTVGYGLILGVHFAFFKAGIMQMDLSNAVNSKGTEVILKSKTLGGQVAAGLTYEVNSYFIIGTSLFSNFGTFGPSKDGFTQNTHFVEYGAKATLTIPLPSGGRMLSQ